MQSLTHYFLIIYIKAQGHEENSLLENHFIVRVYYEM